ncbi:MAG: hypothetical protein K6B72_09500 [Lachnospiraceae bacterium]|nr:hypothetical protein [Lachnospiraceae bacterium]
MKGFRKITATLLIAALCASLAACGSEDDKEKKSSKKSKDRTEDVREEDSGEYEEEDEEEYEEEEDPEEFYDEEDLTDGEEYEDAASLYDDPNDLPPYVYTGTDEYLGVISEYLAGQDGGGSTVYIPFSIIAEVDTSDPEDILVFGSYNVDGYELYNTTLFASNGSRGRGIFHLRDNGGSYEVIGADLPMTDQESTELFAPYAGIDDKIRAITEEEKERAREEAIAGYVNANGLHITQWGDYGWPLHAVLNAPPTAEEDQFYTYVSELGYAVTYDLRELSLSHMGSEDMLGKVEGDLFSGTFMVVRLAEDAADPDEALQTEISRTDEKPEITDATIGSGISCRRAEWNAELDDGRIFRYIGYSFNTERGVMLILLETTYEKGVSEMSMEDMAAFFAGPVDSLTLMQQ